MTEKTRVVIIDDHLVVREGVRNLLKRSPKIEIVAEGSAGNHVFSLVEKHRPHVLLTDLLMPAHEDEPKEALFEPVSTLAEVGRRFPETAIMVLSQEDDIQIIQSLADVGVRGYLLKTDSFAAVLDRAVEMIRMGATYFSPDVQEVILRAPRLNHGTELTDRQLQTLQAIVRNPEISRERLAQNMNISRNTLQKHINGIFTVLNVSNMVSCIIKAMRMRLVDVDEILGES